MYARRNHTSSIFDTSGWQTDNLDRISRLTLFNKVVTRSGAFFSALHPARTL